MEHFPPLQSKKANEWVGPPDPLRGMTPLIDSIFLPKIGNVTTFFKSAFRWIHWCASFTQMFIALPYHVFGILRYAEEVHDL